MALQQCGEETLGGQSGVKLSTPFIKSSTVKMTEVQTPEQVIFATSFEDEFYTTLTNHQPG
jgi:hypothetical protein